MRITYFGHSSFLIEGSGGAFLTDPFISKNGMSKTDISTIECSMIFVSHGHADHVGDTNEIAKKNNATICGIPELMRSGLVDESINFQKGNIGGIIPTSFGTAKFVSATHSSGLTGGNACGFVFEVDGNRIYFAGDTGLTADHALLENIDIALLPIGGVFTMDEDDAIRAAKMMNAKLVIPMHYNTFPAIKKDPHNFVKKLNEKANIKGIVIDIDASIQL